MGGADKLLENVDGMPLLRRQAVAGLDAALSVVVTLPPERPARHAALDGLSLRLIVVDDAAEGMGASIRAGMTGIAPPTTGVIVLPADMPEIGAPELRAVMDAHAKAPRAVIRGATADGRAGHPVLFPARLFGRLRRLAGDTGAKPALSGETPRLVSLPPQMQQGHQPRLTGKIRLPRDRHRFGLLDDAQRQPGRERPAENTADRLAEQHARRPTPAREA